MYEVELNDGTVWKRHNDQLLIDKSTTTLNDPISLTSAKEINENLENNQSEPDLNPNPRVTDKTPRPIRSKIPPQRYSPSDYE